ncbi:MAG: DegT/DnrJ/EryC1/StrS family aminotransferase [Saprospiraceae bacterium]
MIQKKYKQAIAEYLNVDSTQISLFWRGRVGLYCILKAMDIQPGDEVILPAFTCVVVPSAIKYLGAKPIYTAIHPATYNIDIEKLEKKITSKTKVILAQNTFGLSSDLDPILAIAKKHGIRVIEDCAHGFGGTYRGRKNGTSATAAFFSSQWNKPFSTGIGGIVLCNDLEIAKKIQLIQASFERPSFKDETMLALQIFIRQNILRPSIYWAALKIYRWASQRGFISGSSDAGELENAKMPSSYLKAGANIQAKKGLEALQYFDKNLAHRQEIATLYNNAFTKLDIEPIFCPEYATHTYIKYPFLVKDQNKFLKLAQQNQIQLGDWLNSPIHPIRENLERWDYHQGSFPIAEKIGYHILNLPTDESISINEAKRIILFLEKNRNEIVPSWANFES